MTKKKSIKRGHIFSFIGVKMLEIRKKKKKKKKYNQQE